MLKTISPLISPNLPEVLVEVGYGGKIIFSDVHFPVNSTGLQVVRADSLLISDLPRTLTPLFELDSYAPPLVIMATVEGDIPDPDIETRYRQALSLQTPCPDITRIDRYAFREQA